MRSLAAFFVAAGCAAPAAPPANSGGNAGGRVPDAGAPAPDGGSGGCVRAKLCWPGCDPSTGTCDVGTLDAAACECRPLAATLRSIALSKPPGAVKPGTPFALSAEGTYADGSTADLTAAATWTTSDASAVRADGGGHFTTIANGAATLAADSAGVRGSVDVTVSDAAAGEARALWITRFAFHKDAVAGPADVKAVVDAAADAHFNVLLFQVRALGDAYYRSTLEPWSDSFGTLGGDPGWDPLQVALDEAHSRGVELHAWVNAFTGWYAPGSAHPWPPPRAAHGPQHLFVDHPDWLATSDASGGSSDPEYRWVSAGIEAARAHLADVVTDLATSYAIDGVHLDRIRFADTAYSQDPLTEAAYEAQRATGLADRGDWQRAMVSDAVRRAGEALHAVRPKAVLSAAVWGIYKPLTVAGAACHTSNGYYQRYQDSLGWMQAGIIDAIAPMIYWDFGAYGGCADWGALNDVFVAGRAGRAVWSGMSGLDGGSYDRAKIFARIEYARTHGAQGTTIFDSAYLPGHWSDFSAPGAPYELPAPAQ